MKNDPHDSVPDEILAELADAVSPILDKIQDDDSYALFVIGVKYIQDEELGEGVQTYLNANGFFEIIEEGLYQELLDQVRNGNMVLFSSLRNVIRDLEDELDLSPDDEVELDDPSPHYH